MTSFEQHGRRAGVMVGEDFGLTAGTRHVELRLPASTEFVRTARMVAASLGTVAGLDVIALDDLRVAVDESCSWLLEHSGGQELVLDFAVGGGEVHVRGGLPGSARPSEPDLVAASAGTPSAALLDLSEELLRVVTTSFRLESAPSWAGFELTKRRTADGA